MVVVVVVVVNLEGEAERYGEEEGDGEEDGEKVAAERGIGIGLAADDLGMEIGAEGVGDEDEVGDEEAVEAWGVEVDEGLEGPSSHHIPRFLFWISRDTNVKNSSVGPCYNSK